MKPKSVAAGTGPPPRAALVQSGKINKPAKQIGELGNLAESRANQLSQSERAELEMCERILEKGLRTFCEVGDALLKIRESRLYRAEHLTFEQYCHERWNIGRTYTWRIIGAAERLKLLPNDDRTPRPASEFQMRPFLKLAPQAFPGAWKQVIETANSGKVTSSIVDGVIRGLLANNPDQARSGKRKKRSKSKLPLGQVLMVINEAKRQFNLREYDKALEAIEKIENLLFGE